LVEQRTFNPLVAGSSPARPTRKQAVTSDSGRFHFAPQIDVLLDSV
jgi:hypothetical protein